MRNKTIQFITTAAIVAALYTVLTILTNFIPPIAGVFQFRAAEAMCILPMFTPAAIPGLALGCLLTNIITGAGVYDVVFGTLATLLGAAISFLLAYRKNDITGGNFILRAILAAIPPIITNALLIPVVIFQVSPELPRTFGSYMLLALDVAWGEAICAGVLGVGLAFALRPHIKRMLDRK